MLPYWAVAVEPWRQRLSIVDFFVALFVVAFTAKRLRIPNMARTTLGNRFHMINAKFFEREFLIALETTKVIELAQGVPLASGIRAACLGFAGTADGLPFLIGLSAFFGFLKALLANFTLISSLMFFTSLLTGFFAFRCLIILLLGAFFRCLIAVSLLILLSRFFIAICLLIALSGFLVFIRPRPTIATHFALASQSIFTSAVFVEIIQRFLLVAFSAFLFLSKHFGVLHAYKRAFVPKFGRTPIAPFCLNKGPV